MSRPECWKIENYNCQPCYSPECELSTAVVLHGHSSYSEENLGILNEIMNMSVLRKVNEFFKRTFPLKPNENLDYSNFHYSSLISPEDVFEMELKAAEAVGFERLLLAITDHDKINGCLELLEVRPELVRQTVVSEELSFNFEGQVFHVGVLGIPTDRAQEYHRKLQIYAAQQRLDDMFGLLQGLECLVILNHPFYQQIRLDHHEKLLVRLLRRYGWAIDALEFNGLRSHAENSMTVELARWIGKPVLGGGDRHSNIASLVLSASREAMNFGEYIEEVKAGRAAVICKRDYFLPLGWKLFVRILQGIKAYRQITFYNKVPITKHLIPDRIFPDYFAGAARFLFSLIESLGLAR